jgi:hypothetical protein
MLHQLTWHQYFAAIIVLAIVYYVTLGFRYYRPELQKLIWRLGGREAAGHWPAALKYQEPEASRESLHTKAVHREEHQQQIPGDYDHLAAELKACIARAADKPFAPAVFIPQLQKILQAQPEPGVLERPAINELIVNECEKTGTARLVADEVDQWWSD